MIVERTEKEIRLKFDAVGHDAFIDFLKAYAISMVVFGHLTPFLSYIGYNIWGGVEVPIFILIQAFHVYKRSPRPINWRVVLFRIFIPFAIIQTAVWIVLHYSSILESDYLNAGMLHGWGGVWSWFILPVGLFADDDNHSFSANIARKIILTKVVSGIYTYFCTYRDSVFIYTS